MENNNIIARIDNDLNHINQMIDWASKFLKKEKGATRSKLIDKRRQLNKIKNALGVNPAASIYGESQVGKSYLVDTVLSDTKGALKFIYGGKEYDFITDFNPQGGAESTSIVSRFTANSNVDNNSEFPILAKMLSVKDALLVIIDSFFNDLTRQKFCGVDEFIQKANEVETEYKESSPNIQTYLSEDDLYDIRDYMLYGTFFDSGYNEAEAIAKSGFFEKVGLYIDRIPVENWNSIFDLLWGKQDFITSIFKKLKETLKELNFEQEVLIRVNAVLRDEGTILDVTRIVELFDKTTDDKSKMMQVKLADGAIKTVSKSSFCALTSELVFEVKEELKKEKAFLNNMDFLDFPGARGRLKIEVDEARNRQSDMALRGKIAYLFNNYYTNYMISNLLFCHHLFPSNINSALSKLLSNWVNIVVGKNKEEREAYLRDSKISPLFLVATKFNLDMVKTINDDVKEASNRRQSQDERWKNRFEKNLTDVIGGREYNKNQSDNAVVTSNSWFVDWTTSQQNFKNTYLLRSFDFSDRGGIFKGYNKLDGDQRVINLDEKGNKTGEQEYGLGYETFLSELKSSFVDNEFVQNHFENPSLYWDEAASIGKDGSGLIIRNLTISAENTAITRRNSFQRQLDTVENYLKKILEDEYHNDSSDTRIKDAKNTAGKIELQLDILFGKDRFFFSQFISKMLISESKIHDLLLNAMHDMKMVEETDTSVYFAVKDKANIDVNLDREENVKRMIKAYHLKGEEELVEHLKSSLGTTIDDILKPKLTRNFSTIITEVVVNEWKEKYLFNNSRYEEFIERGLRGDLLNSLMKNMENLFNEILHVDVLISNKIRKYVLNMEKIDAMAEMLADISSEMINKFVNEMGYSYYSEHKLESIVKANNENNLELDMDISSIEEKSVYENQTIEKIFDVLNNIDEVLQENPIDKEKIKYLPNYSSFERWTKLMKLSFIAACHIPTYDRLANEELGKIIESYYPEYFTNPQDHYAS